MKCNISILRVLNLFESVRETYATSEGSARQVLDEGYRHTLAARVKDLRLFVIEYRKLNANPQAWAPLDTLIGKGDWGQ